MDWKLFLNNARKGFSEFNNVSPETFEGFSKMGKPVKRNGELTEKTKEFIALGIAIATRCESCIGFHVASLVRLGATKGELVEALSMASYMGGGPSITYSAKALEAYEQFTAK